MFFQNINYWTVIISGIASMGLGFLWYSPIVFGKRFMKEMGMTPEKVEEYKKRNGPSGMIKMYIPTFVLALVMAFIVATLINSLVITSIGGFVTLALCLWAGFSLPVAANNTNFGNDSKALMFINTGYQLVNILIATLIIGIWG